MRSLSKNKILVTALFVAVVILFTFAQLDAPGSRVHFNTSDAKAVTQELKETVPVQSGILGSQ